MGWQNKIRITIYDQINQNDRTHYNAIDVIKFMCSILVVMIHIAPCGENSENALLNYVIQNCVARIGVPFFFISSSFFLYRKCTLDDFNVKPSKDYVLKILRLYIIWSIIYMPLSIKGIIGDEKGILHGILCYIRNILLVGSYTQLWYLNATIVGVVIVSFLLYKKCKVRNIIIISTIFYVAGLLTQSWFGIIKPLSTYLPHIWKLLRLFKKVFVTTRNGLFEGLIFIGIGVLFAHFKIIMSIRKAIWGFAISYLLLFSEALFVKYFHLIRTADLYIFLVPTTFFLFYIAKNLKLKDNKVYLTLRQLSSLIFYMHLWVGVVVTKVFYLLFDINIGESCLKFVITLNVTIIVALGIIKLSKCKYFHWLRYLYA